MNAGSSIGSKRVPFGWAAAVRIAALACIAILAGAALRHQHRVAGDVLAFTTCPFRGPAVVVTAPGLATEDTLPVRLHEEVHAAQCRALGPVRYRIRNLTGTGKLSLEVPAYCAAAEARVRSGWTRRNARERLNDDIQAAMSGVVDSAVISQTLRRDCPLAS